ncbi:MAG: DUF2892 domain-containing protein [bacterium]|nr:MAG: DUF2892 domain-containing protein [bacterium]
MKTNMGKTDKIIRLVVGLIIIIWGIAAGSWWGLIGLIPLLTAFVNWCPLYALLGISTKKVKTE